MSQRLAALSADRQITRDDVRAPVHTGPGKTKQEFKDECDINNIIRRFVKDGFLRHMARGVPQFMDVSDLPDFRTAVDQVRATEEFFGKLPAKLRAKFGNDPARFLDEAGKMTRAELREFGLAELRKDDRPARRASDGGAEEDEKAAARTVTS